MWLEIEMSLKPFYSFNASQTNNQTNSQHLKDDNSFDSNNDEILEVFEKERYLFHQIFDHYLPNEFSNNVQSLATFLLDRLVQFYRANFNCGHMVSFVNVLQLLIQNLKTTVTTNEEKRDTSVWLLDFFKNNITLQKLQIREQSHDESVENGNGEDSSEREAQNYLTSLLYLLRFLPSHLFFVGNGTLTFSPRSLTRAKEFFTSSFYIDHRHLFRCRELLLSSNTINF
jgi:hypothetical protein